MLRINDRTDEENPDPRVACALLLDVSGSMAGERIAALNKGFELFCSEINGDPIAKKRAEVCVITFGGGGARVAIPFTAGRDLQPQHFQANGGTPMGAALDMALGEIAAQKDAYKDADLEYYRPWLFILTDGAPTDGLIFDAAATRVMEAEAGGKTAVFAVMVGGADKTQLRQISTREPVDLQGLQFVELFMWLSASMSAVSMSNEHGSNDNEVTAKNEDPMAQTALPTPESWLKV